MSGRAASRVRVCGPKDPTRSQPPPGRCRTVASRTPSGHLTREHTLSQLLRGSLRISRKPVRAAPGGRVIAQFRKNHARRDLCLSFPGSCSRPCRTRREEPAPVAAGVVAQFREKHPRPCNRRLLATAAPSRPLPPVGLHHGRRGNPPVPVLRAMRHSALACPPAPRTMTLRAARAQLQMSPPGAGENRPPHSSPAAAAARDAGVLICSGATGPV
jgi:hypothetical protein